MELDSLEDLGFRGGPERHCVLPGDEHIHMSIRGNHIVIDVAQV